jgi:hypothetical protein
MVDHDRGSFTAVIACAKEEQGHAILMTNVHEIPVSSRRLPPRHADAGGARSRNSVDASRLFAASRPPAVSGSDVVVKNTPKSTCASAPGGTWSLSKMGLVPEHQRASEPLLDDRSR